MDTELDNEAEATVAADDNDENNDEAAMTLREHLRKQQTPMRTRRHRLRLDFKKRGFLVAGKIAEREGLMERRRRTLEKEHTI